MFCHSNEKHDECAKGTTAYGIIVAIEDEKTPKLLSLLVSEPAPNNVVTEPQVLNIHFAANGTTSKRAHITVQDDKKEIVV